MENTLVLIQYDSPADQVYLVKHTTEIYGYFENPLSENNAMLSIITEEQRGTLLGKGYIIQTIEETPRMENYVLLYHAEVNQGNAVSQLGRVYQVTGNYTLIRLDEGKTFVPTGANAEYAIIPLEEMRTDLAEQNSVELPYIPEQEEAYIQESISVTTNPDGTSDNSIHLLGGYIVFGSLILTILLIMVVLVYIRRTRTMNT